MPKATASEGQLISYKALDPNRLLSLKSSDWTPKHSRPTVQPSSSPSCGTPLFEDSRSYRMPASEGLGTVSHAPSAPYAAVKGGLAGTPLRTWNHFVGMARIHD